VEKGLHSRHLAAWPTQFLHRIRSRGGAEPLLTTLDAYFAAGGVTTETARRLHLSVRAVTYRLGRIKALTGYDATDPAQRFTINAAVLGAKLLGWPEHNVTVDR
jgi:DNA-binding PucR family transcriptional regulator